MYSLRSPEIPFSPPGRPEFPCGSPQGPDFDYRRGPLPPSPQPRYPDEQSLTTSLPPPCSGSFCLPVLPNTQLLHLRIQSRRRKRTQVRASPLCYPHQSVTALAKMVLQTVRTEEYKKQTVIVQPDFPSY